MVKERSLYFGDAGDPFAMDSGLGRGPAQGFSGGVVLPKRPAPPNYRILAFSEGQKVVHAGGHNIRRASRKALVLPSFLIGR